MIEGLLDLYEATFDGRWLTAALELNAVAMRDFYDAERGGFYFTAKDHEVLLTRAKDVRDGATPSGNSVQLMNLLRLAVMTGDESLRAAAHRTIAHLAPQVLASPGSGDRFLAAVEFAQAGPVEIAIVGDPADAAAQALLRTVHATYLPNRVLLLRRPGDAGFAADAPLLRGRELVDGRPAAYVCRGYACRRPVTKADELAAQLATEYNALAPAS